MINFESKNVDQLRALLVSNNAKTEEEAQATKGKTNLVYEVKKAIASGLIRDYSAIQDTDDGAIEIPLELEEIGEEVTYQDPIAKPEKTKLPKIHSLEWQDFVLAQFSSEELLGIGKGKYPTVVGLRRVVELLLGEIVFSGPTQVFPALDGASVGRASVLYKLDIAWRADNTYVDLNAGLPLRTFCATAEAWSENIPDDRFKPYPLTIAETRAEGRALRKALFLKIQSAEEIVGTEMPTKESVSVVEEYNENEPISTQQISVIRSMCVNLNIDVDKLAPDVQNLKKKDGTELLKKINQYQTGDIKIPNDLLKE